MGQLDRVLKPFQIFKYAKVAGVLRRPLYSINQLP